MKTLIARLTLTAVLCTLAAFANGCGDSSTLPFTPAPSGTPQDWTQSTAEDQVVDADANDEDIDPAERLETKDGGHHER